MPLATFLCIDSSDYMRNGDYSPNRIMAVQDACNLLAESLMQRNPENVIGFLTFGGKACAVRETLTEDIDRVTGSLASIAVGGESLFGYGVQIAMLALSHVKNTRSDKQIVVFVGSPIRDSPERLAQLAKALRKDDVGISVISLGVANNTPLLQTFIDAVGKNAHLYVIPENGSILDVMFNSPLMGVEGGMGGGGGVPASGGQALGQDADDPHLAMAIRASIEEDQRRQAAAAQQDNNSASATTGAQQQPQQQAQAPPEEDDLELALRLSMETALRDEQNNNNNSSALQPANQQQPASTSANADAAGPSTGGGSTANRNEMAEFEAALQDPDVLAALQQIAGDDDKKPAEGGDKKKPDGGDKKPGSD